MLKEPRNRELTREDIYAEYFSRQMDGNEHITEDFAKKINEVNEIFKGKKELEIMIRGTIMFDRNYNKLFTFLNRTYQISKVNFTETPLTGLKECLSDLEVFDKFMSGDYINYFSREENEYVNYTRVLNAHISYELR